MSNLASSTVCGHSISQTFQPFAKVQEPADLQVLVLHSFSKYVLLHTHKTPHIPSIYNYLAMKEGKQSSAQYGMFKRKWIKWFKTVLWSVLGSKYKHTIEIKLMGGKWSFNVSHSWSTTSLFHLALGLPSAPKSTHQNIQNTDYNSAVCLLKHYGSSKGLKTQESTTFRLYFFRHERKGQATVPGPSPFTRI